MKIALTRGVGHPDTQKEVALMNRRIWVAIAAVAASAAATAQQATYDFTGTVTSSSFASLTIGMTITGTYTINLGNADLSADGLSFNNISTIGPWMRGVAGGAMHPNSPPEAGAVFSSTATVGSSVFASPAPSPIGNFSYVEAGPFVYNAYDTEYTSRNSFLESNFNIQNTSGTLPYTSSGLPLFGVGSIGTGSILFETNVPNAPAFDHASKLDYSITSFTRANSAPEIDPVSSTSGLTLLLGAMAVLRGRRKVA
jgi:hypothetical protein